MGVQRRKSGVQSFLSGLSITLGNPKVIFFYIGFHLTFVDLNTLNSMDINIFGLVVSLMLDGVMGFYAAIQPLKFAQFSPAKPHKPE